MLRFGPDLARALGRAIVADYEATRSSPAGFDCGTSVGSLVEAIEAAVTGSRTATINLVGLRPADARLLARACVSVSQIPGPQQRAATSRLYKVCRHFNLSVVDMVGMIEAPVAIPDPMVPAA